MACLSEEKIVAFASGRLGPQERREAETHLDGCVSCRVTVAEVSTMLTLGPEFDAGLGDESLLDAEGPLAKGTAIGRYLVIQVVGGGAGGVVYEAYDPQLGRKVGLKLLRVKAKGDAMLKRLLAEAQAMARLSHPNVVAVFDAGVHDGWVYIVLEFVEGQTLTAWLQQNRRSPGEIIEVFTDVAQGLAAAHHAGVIHRDVKPDNMMVTAEGVGRLTDFGLAQSEGHSDELAVAGRGTPAFMAPEQRASGATSAASDQFSFCLALDWALHGRTLPPLRHARSKGLRRRVRRALARGMRNQPAERWKSMDDLLAAIRPRRTPWGLLGIAALAVVALLGGWRLWSAPPPKTRVELYPHCRDALYGEGGHCFLQEQQPRDFAGAQAWCEAHSGYLATCVSVNECRSINRAIATGTESWIGMRVGAKGEPQWLTDEVLLPHARITHKRRAEQNCAFAAKAAMATQWQWDACETVRGFLCETPSFATNPASKLSYRVNPQPLTHENAEAACRRNDGRLARVRTEGDQLFLEAMLALDITTYPVLWLGARRASNGADLLWNDGSKLAWQNFAFRQPDNFDGQQGCLAIDMKSKGWHDRYCSARHASICEYELVPDERQYGAR